MLTFFSPTGLLVLGLTRGDLVHLESSLPVGFKGPRADPQRVRDVLVVFGETPSALLDLLVTQGFDVPESLRAYATRIDGDDDDSHQQ